VYEDAIFRGQCASNPALATRRKLREARSKRERGQFAALPFIDAPAFVVELRAGEGIAARCLEFALLTASRTNEAIVAEWSELDLVQGVWSVPKDRMKACEPHTEPVVRFEGAGQSSARESTSRRHLDWVRGKPLSQEGH
jgi:integrase